MKVQELFVARQERKPRRREAAEQHAPRALGGLPQVSLLPGEVRDAGAAVAHRRRLVAVVALGAAVAVAAVGVAGAVASGATQQLAAQTATSAQVSTQIAKFSALRSLEARIALGRSAVKVGGSTLIDWQTQIEAIEASMPSSYAVTQISANGATPLVEYQQSANALEPRRAATVVMVLSAPSIGDEYSIWLRQLRSIPGYADASAPFTSTSGSDYTITLTVHLRGSVISPAAGSEQ